jgi:6-phosphogluconate dehydrogenase
MRACARASDSPWISPIFAEVWRRGSVISSWLLDLTAMALAEDSALANFSGDVEDSGEGRWTSMRRLRRRCPPMFSRHLFSSAFVPGSDHNFGDMLLSAMRFKFGGHVEHPAANTPGK